MIDLEELSKKRKLISHMLKIATKGEINDFDFVVDFISTGRPLVSLYLGVPGNVKKKYDGFMEDLLNTHMETIRKVISTAGFPQIFKVSMKYEIL